MAPPRALTLAAALVLLVASCTAQVVPTVPQSVGCACPAILEPVCVGTRRFDNACQANCAGFEEYGPCGAAGPTLQEQPPPTATPPTCACPRDAAQVCGEDGTTYWNSCLARCAGVAVVSQGACGTPAAARPTQPAAAQPAGQMARPLQQPVQPATPACVCALIFAPVCGVDGKTYANACGARCEGVAVVSQGECKPAVVPPPPRPLPPTPQPAAAPVCACSREFAQVCGSDGKTHANPCLAKCAGATVVSQGPCGAPQQPTRPAQPATPACACPRNLFQVCGSDGVTHQNPCLAECAGANVVREGPCTAPASTTRPGQAAAPAAALAPAAQPAAGGNGGACNCPKDTFEPVCGRDGLTYENKCVAGCLRTPVAYDGVCKQQQGGGIGGTTVAPGTPVTPTPEPSRPVGPAGPAGPAGGPAGGSAGPCNCPRVYSPVCGSDMTTYNNACLAGCAGVPFLTGPCPSFGGGFGGRDGGDDDDDEEDDRRGSLQDAIVSSCPCPRLFLPVCGADGRRYASSCHARCNGVIAVRSALLRGCR